MADHIVGLQVPAPKQDQKQPPQQEQQRHRTARSLPIGEFIIDDLKLFVSPVTAVVGEFLKQVKR